MPAPHDYKSNRCVNSVRVDAPAMVVKACADGDADVTPHPATSVYFLIGYSFTSNSITPAIMAGKSENSIQIMF